VPTGDDERHDETGQHGHEPHRRIGGKEGHTRDGERSHPVVGPLVLGLRDHLRHQHEPDDEEQQRRRPGGQEQRRLLVDLGEQEPEADDDPDGEDGLHTDDQGNNHEIFRACHCTSSA
jgi:hypothetical protein